MKKIAPNRKIVLSVSGGGWGEGYGAGSSQVAETRKFLCSEYGLLYVSDCVTAGPFLGASEKKNHIFQKKIKICLDSDVELVYTAVTATQCAVPEKEKAPVAQLDRASDYGSEGLRFESSRACFS